MKAEAVFKGEMVEDEVVLKAEETGEAVEVEAMEGAATEIILILLRITEHTKIHNLALSFFVDDRNIVYVAH